MKSFFVLAGILSIAALACTTNTSSGGSDDACSELADKCAYCTDPGLKATCQNAVASNDPSSCQNGLDDKDVQSNCVASSGGGDSGSGGNDSGSTSNDSGGGGPVVDTCTVGHDCSCPAGATCTFTCSTNDTCAATCATGSTCSLGCLNGACTLNCESGASCTQNCANGSCDGIGNGSTEFEQNCGNGSCDLTCSSVTSCKQSTGTGTHSCSGCN